MKKRLKQLCEILENLLIMMLPVMVAIGIALLGMWISYMIATSDLPDWFKFWLLK